VRTRFIRASLLFLAFLVISTAIVTQPVIRRVEKEVDRTSRVVARLFSTLIISAVSQEDVAKSLRTIMRDVDFPMVITDEFGIPRAWRKVGVSPLRFTAEELNNPELLKYDPDFKKLLWVIGRMERLHPPMPIRRGDKIVGYLYYGEPRVLDYLRMLPFVLMAVGLLSFLGLFWAARSLRTYEVEALWTSFAKMLAHQMGTPVSSLFGWFEFLKRKGIDPTLEREMERDLNRLRSILSRFSRIGGGERLTLVDLSRTIEHTVEEAKTRFLKGVKVDLNLEDGAYTEGDPELLSWAIENLIKNAYEARTNMDPRIEVRLEKGDRFHRILVIDNGKGIPRDKRRILFKKRFTTKEKGWGMGLLLTRRIVRDVHNGRIRLIKSQPMVETVFEIQLPRAG
jgi:hypothetical protein